MENIIERIHQFSEKIPEGGCWIWMGSIDKDGYGQFPKNSDFSSAHRASFSAFVRPIKDGEWVLHHCDNPSCVNPYHLYGGDASDNRRDMLVRNRWSHSFRRRDSCSAGHQYVEGSFKLSNKDGARLCKICRKLAKRRSRNKTPA